jgi:hypothetical protein
MAIREGTGLAFSVLRSTRLLPVKVSLGIMVSIWWLLWAFVIGGYSGMLLISLLVIGRRARAQG